MLVESNGQKVKIDPTVANTLRSIDDLAQYQVGSSIMLPTTCLLYTSPSPRDQRGYRMPSSA